MEIKTTRYTPKMVTGSKQVILNKLCEAIHMTTAGDDLVALRYDAERELVHADFECAYDARQINVAMDSGWAMIKDVVNNLDLS